MDHGFGMRGSEEIPLERVQRIRQVHGARVVELPGETPEEEADAGVTDFSGEAVAVVTADCVPVLLAALRPHPVVAAVHAGWRGSALEIVRHAVQALCDWKQVLPNDLTAAIGPHIGSCCYEVDEPVRDAIRSEACFHPAETHDRWMLDLDALNRAQLIAAGIPEARIARVGAAPTASPRA